MSDGAERARRKEELKKLVKKYKDLFDKKRAYGLKKISEADVRANFIDKLFEILGWDTGNMEEYNREQYVRPGFADITLMIGGNPVAFVEAKRFQIIPWVDRKTIDWIEEERQVMNYAASIDPPVKWAILTNFERLRVFNALNGNLIMAFEDVGDYEKRFDELLYLSKESFESGRIDALETHEERPDIDLRFLDMLNKWRLELAKDIYERNRKNPALLEDGEISLPKVKEAIQRLIDRLIIVRYAEDRFILESPDILKTLMRPWESAKDYINLKTVLNDYFRGFDKIHDSSIFEEGHVLDSTEVGSEVLASLINDLYTVNFRRFDFDILGNTYETYLGKTLALDKDGKIVLKQVQETRKKSGIYYTPPYVVDYIVKNTLGEALKEKSADEVKNLRVLDPSCGSGSFLIKAYDYFVDFYEEENRKIDEKRKKMLREIGKNGNGLEEYGSIAKKYSDYEKEILRNNIYGVDLDEHAAEIAAVNLMLKALKQKEKLPLILGDHIKVGNSLISGDEELLKKYFGDNWEEKRPFNWEEEFPEVFQGDNPGFDVIIGNPPWVRTKEADRKGHKGYSDLYREYVIGESNLYKLFMLKSLCLMRNNGLFSYIVPNSYLRDRDSEKLREFILDNCRIKEIISFSEKCSKDMFKGQITQATTIFIFEKTNEKKKRENNKISISETIDEPKVFIKQSYKNIEVDQRTYSTLPFKTFVTPKNRAEMDLLLRLEENFSKFSRIVDTFDGEVHLTKYKERIYDKLEDGRFPLIRGENLSSPYFIDYPEDYRKGSWFEPRDFEFSIDYRKTDRILVQQVSNIKQKKRIKACIPKRGIYAGNTTVSIIMTNEEVNIKAVLALLNSKLLNWYFKLYSSTNHVTGREIKNLPVVDSGNSGILSDLAALADRMLSLNKELALIDTNFEDYVNRHGRIKDEKLRNYLDINAITVLKDGKGTPASMIEHDKKDLKVRAVMVEERGENLLFSVKVEDRGKTRVINVFSVPLENEALRKFIYHSVRTFVKPSNVGKGNLYEKLLDLRIPRFESSREKNMKVIEEIMALYLPALEVWNRIKREIEETDREIDSKVYALYGLTDEEIRIIEDSFGDD